MRLPRKDISVLEAVIFYAREFWQEKLPWISCKQREDRGFAIGRNRGVPFVSMHSHQDWFFSILKVIGELEFSNALGNGVAANPPSGLGW